MRTFEQERTRATVHFLITTIVLCVAAFFYIKLYYPFRNFDGSLMEKVQANLKNVVLFGLASGVWLANWISCHGKYRRLKLEFGAGGLFGRLLLLVELVGFVLVIAFLLMK